MEPSTWEELAATYLEGFEPGVFCDRLLEAIVGRLPRSLTEAELVRFRRCDSTDQRKLARLLDGARTRHVVKMIVFAARSVPEGLLLPMLRAGVLIADPSYNKQFIWPCVLCHGRRRVLTILLSIARDGSDFEKAGALNARYWASMPESTISWPHDRPRSALDRDDDEPIDDLNDQWDAWVVCEFRRNPNVDVLRALVNWLPEHHRAAPAELEKAIKIAAAHPDPYIRQRLAVHLGESTLYPCYPHSSPSWDDTS